MKGIVSCFSPEETIEIFLKSAPSDSGFEYKSEWWHVKPTLVCFRTECKSKEDSISDQFIYLKIEVPHKSETEIWSQIYIDEDGGIQEAIVFTCGVKFTVALGYEVIMKKLENNFEQGILNEMNYEESVRILKAARLNELF